MPLTFVTGASGAGKSTVRSELRRRGFSAFDTDEDEIAQWRSKTTGEITPLAAEAHRTPEFLAENEWIADPGRVRELAMTVAGDMTFLCGLVGNEDDVWPLFANVILLSIDEATMRHRLLTRTDHDFGTRPHELSLLLAWRAVVDDHYMRRGAMRVDATNPPSVVVDDIVSLVIADGG